MRMMAMRMIAMRMDMEIRMNRSGISWFCLKLAEMFCVSQNAEKA